MTDRPKLRKRLTDETLRSLFSTGSASLADIMLVGEAVATTMLAHPEWPDE